MQKLQNVFIVTQKYNILPFLQSHHYSFCSHEQREKQCLHSLKELADFLLRKISNLPVRNILKKHPETHLKTDQPLDNFTGTSHQLSKRSHRTQQYATNLTVPVNKKRT